MGCLSVVAGEDEWEDPNLQLELLQWVPWGKWKIRKQVEMGINTAVGSRNRNDLEIECTV